MTEFLDSSDISVLSDHITNEELGDVTFAGITWPEGVAADTYTIPLGQFVSVELDRHVPVRPESITVYDIGIKESLPALEMLFGEEIARLLQDTPMLGSLALTTRLNPNNRLKIATLQVANPSTPAKLKAPALGLIEELTRSSQRDIDRLAG